MRSVSILGVTGSVGQSAVEVILSHPDLFSVRAVTAHKNVIALADLAKKVNAKHAIIADENLYQDLKKALSGTLVKAAAGRQAMMDAAASGADVTIAAIVGVAGLPYVMRAVAAGKTVAIANKEPLVVAGPLVMAAAAESGATILPVDSEHNAIYQVFEKRNKSAIRSVVLTASGGPFRGWEKARIQSATIEEALRHPNWSMGKKITIDCATLMNKGLEMIEAKVLFNLRADQVDAIIHPQSIIHGFVEYEDGSVLAQMAAPDMRLPISYALSYPNRMNSGLRRLAVKELTALHFETPDEVKFPCLALARQVLNQGLPEAIALNAANEVAVEAFLSGRISFGYIADIVKAALEKVNHINPLNVDDVLGQDSTVREHAKSYIISKVA